MEQFSLEKWLKNKSRKVVTADGRPVRIICWNAENSKPIVALVSTRSISQRQFDELTINYFNDGTYYGGAQEDLLDLFFADDEEELTEFEKAMQEYYFPELDDFELKRFAKGILDLARREIEKENPYSEKQNEQKPAWSEEDERLLNNMVIVIQDYYNKEDAQSLTSWLKSLKERV